MSFRSENIMSLSGVDYSKTPEDNLHEHITAIAKGNGLKILAGAWLSHNKDQNGELKYEN